MKFYCFITRERWVNHDASSPIQYQNALQKNLKWTILTAFSQPFASLISPYQWQQRYPQTSKKLKSIRYSHRLKQLSQPNYLKTFSHKTYMVSIRLNDVCNPNIFESNRQHFQINKQINMSKRIINFRILYSMFSHVFKQKISFNRLFIAQVKHLKRKAVKMCSNFKFT